MIFIKRGQIIFVVVEKRPPTGKLPVVKIWLGFEIRLKKNMQQESEEEKTKIIMVVPILTTSLFYNYLFLQLITQKKQCLGITNFYNTQKITIVTFIKNIYIIMPSRN